MTARPLRVFGLAAVLSLGGCNSNKKLSQGNAEEAIRTFASTHPVQFRGGGNGCSLTLQGISRIEPLSQFSEAEATTVVALKCGSGGDMLLNFVFQKDINAKWFLTQIKHDARYQVDSDLIQMLNQNLRVPAQ